MTDATVFLVDDDPSVRDALSLLISLKGLRTAVFASAEAFLETYSPQWRGCLLTDLQMQGMHGLDLQKQLIGRGIELAVVVLTAHGDVATARAALKNGAVDFLEKPVDDAVLVEVLQNAIRLDGERRSAARARDETLELLCRLTARERDVLQLLAAGLQHRDIAERLQISPRTVEVYKARMMDKLRFRNLAEVVRFGTAMLEKAPLERDV